MVETIFSQIFLIFWLNFADYRSLFLNIREIRQNKKLKIYIVAYTLASASISYVSSISSIYIIIFFLFGPKIFKFFLNGKC